MMLEFLNDRRYPFLLFSKPVFGDTLAFLGVLITFLWGDGDLGKRIQMSGVGFNDQHLNA